MHHSNAISTRYKNVLSVLLNRVNFTEKHLKELILIISLQAAKIKVAELVMVEIRFVDRHYRVVNLICRSIGDRILDLLAY